MKGHSCHSSTVKSECVGSGADNALVFPDYSVQYTGSFGFEH